jgi:fructose-1,6-bisphosphatase/sedoheptulose 1,7-bisphosphatase-like protein
VPGDDRLHSEPVPARLAGRRVEHHGDGAVAAAIQIHLAATDIDKLMWLRKYVAGSRLRHWCSQ